MARRFGEYICEREMQKPQILHHFDLNKFIGLFTIQYDSENTIVCSDKIVALKLHRDIATVFLKNGIDTNEMNGPVREVVVSILQYKGCILNVKRGNLMCNIHYTDLRKKCDNTPFECGLIKITVAEIRCQCNYAHRIVKSPPFILDHLETNL